MASIRKVKTKKGTGYHIQYYDTDGSRKNKTVYVSLKKAKEIAVTLEVKKSLIKAGLAPEPASIKTLEKVVDDYLVNGTRSKTPETIKREEKVYKTLKVELGHIPISRITPKQMEQYFISRQDGGVSPAGVGLELRTVKAFFNYQIRMKTLATNPAVGIKPPRQLPKQIRFLTRDEISRLLEKVDDLNYKDLIMAYLNTGARRREILAPNFEWTDVQFNLNRVRLNGKGDKVRYVPMNAVLREILERRKAAGHEYPFKMNYHWMFKKISKYYSAAKIENANIHTLRKSFGSLLIAQKVDVFRVSKLLGHSSVVVTQLHYADILKDDLETTISCLESLFTDEGDS
jgi:integrase/recombinase XerD